MDRRFLDHVWNQSTAKWAWKSTVTWREEWHPAESWLWSPARGDNGGRWTVGGRARQRGQEGHASPGARTLTWYPPPGSTDGCPSKITSEVTVGPARMERWVRSGYRRNHNWEFWSFHAIPTSDLFLFASDLVGKLLCIVDVFHVTTRARHRAEWFISFDPHQNPLWSILPLTSLYRWVNCCMERWGNSCKVRWWVSEWG